MPRLGGAGSSTVGGTVTQVSGIPYRRHGPTAALRQFLDPLDPGDYFDCGRARLHGLDDALLAEARARGRTIGDDAFLLVATDMGLVFCRPVDLVRHRRPLGGHHPDPAPGGRSRSSCPVTWPRHGELKFTLSKRLAGNIFRRWLQLRMQAARRARDVETGQHRIFTPFEAGVATGPSAGTSEPQPPASDDEEAERSLVAGPRPGSVDDIARSDGHGPIDRPDRTVRADGAEVDPSEAGGEARGEAVDARPPGGAELDVDRRPRRDRQPDGATRRSTTTPVFAAITDRPRSEMTELDGLADDALERVTDPRDRVVTPTRVGSDGLGGGHPGGAQHRRAQRGGIGQPLPGCQRARDRSRNRRPESEPMTARPRSTTRRFRPWTDPEGGLERALGAERRCRPAGSGWRLPVRCRRRVSSCWPCNPESSDPAPGQSLLQQLRGLRDRCQRHLPGSDVDCPGHRDGRYEADREVQVLAPDLYGLDQSTVPGWPASPTR